MIAIPYIVENVIIGLGALGALYLTAHQVYVDFVTQKAQHKLLRVTHGLAFLAALAFAFVQCDPKALYGMYTISALNFMKALVVLFLFMAAQCLMVAYVYALTKSNLGRRPVHLIRVLQVSSCIYGVVLLSLMITEASVNGAYFGGVPLLCEACYCFYLFCFSMYATMDLKRSLNAHSSSKMAATTPQVKGALRRVRNVQILMVCATFAGMAYQTYIGVGLVTTDPSVPVPVANPDVYPVLTPFANVITLLCILALVYAAYHSRRTVHLKPTVQDSAFSGEKSSHSEFDRQHSSLNLDSNTKPGSPGSSQQGTSITVDPEPL